MKELIKYSRMINMKGAWDYQCRPCTALWGTVCVFLPLTCPGWCWWCWFCQRRWRSWSGSQSHGRSAEPHLPARKHRQTQISFFCGTFFFLLQNSSKAVRCPHLHLLLVVLTGHVQNKHAIAKRADGDACKHSTTISGYFLFKMSITIPNHVTNTR